jgi:DNA-binding NarL/FixJ family response regulator
MRRLNLVVAEDHGLMVEAVRIALADRPEFEIVGVAESGSELLPLVRETKPDLVLLDLRMPGIDGFGCTRLMQKEMPTVKIAVFSGFDSDGAVEQALTSGASAFISKSIDPNELPKALLAAYEGTVPEPIGRAESSQAPAVREAGLTERELEILHALTEGCSNKQIAQGLWLAEQTVKFHLTNIYRKLGVRSRTEAVRWAYRHGLDTASTSML